MGGVALREPGSGGPGILRWGLRQLRSGGAWIRCALQRLPVVIAQSVPPPEGGALVHAERRPRATGGTVYDATYLAVAEVRGARLWTADARLVRAVAGSGWEDLVVLLEPGGSVSGVSRPPSTR